MKNLRWTIQHTIFSAALLIALSIVYAVSTPAIGQSRAPALQGPYTISSGDVGMVWRIDTATGLVSYCYRDTNSTSEEMMKSRPPICSGWGQ